MAIEVLPGQQASLRDLIEESRSGEPKLLNLHWEEFHSGVERFLKAVDIYALKAKQEIGDRAQDHVSAVRELKAEKDETERQIQLEQQQERDMLQAIEMERHTVADLSTSLARLQTSLNKVKEASANFDGETAAVRTEVLAERATKERQGKVLHENRSLDETELSAMERALGLSIAGVGVNRLLFLFTLIDPAHPSREFSFVIDVTGQGYSVPQCDPPLASMPDLVAELNADKKFYSFIKRVRQAFVDFVQPSEANGQPTPSQLPASQS